MAHDRVEKVTDVMKEGDAVDVKVISVDREGKIRLTRRELLAFPEGPRATARASASSKRASRPPCRSGGGDGAG